MPALRAEQLPILLLPAGVWLGRPPQPRQPLLLPPRLTLPSLLLTPCPRLCVQPFQALHQGHARQPLAQPLDLGVVSSAVMDDAPSWTVTRASCSAAGSSSTWMDHAA